MNYRPNKVKKIRKSKLLNMKRQKRLDYTAEYSKEKRKSILRILASVILGSILLLIGYICYSII